ncbi:MAG: hypothetical protein AB1331_01525 [Bacillota bacterium]
MNKLATRLRWLARVLSIPLVIIVVAMMSAPDPHQVRPIILPEVIQLSLLAGSVTLGTLVGWWSERLGGIISAASLVLFCLT